MKLSTKFRFLIGLPPKKLILQNEIYYRFDYTIVEKILNKTWLFIFRKKLIELPNQESLADNLTNISFQNKCDAC